MNTEGILEEAVNALHREYKKDLEISKDKVATAIRNHGIAGEYYDRCRANKVKVPDHEWSVITFDKSPPMSVAEAVYKFKDAADREGWTTPEDKKTCKTCNYEGWCERTGECAEYSLWRPKDEV